MGKEGILKIIYNNDMPIMCICECVHIKKWLGKE